MSARTFSIEEAQHFAGSMDAPSRLASSFAGVTPNTIDNNEIVIRRNAAKGILWQLEGVEIPAPNHLSGMFSGGGRLTTIEIASNYPERIEKLILASAVSKEWLDKNGKLYKAGQRLFNPKIEGFIWGMIRFFSSLFPNMIAKTFYPEFTTNLPHKLKKEDVKELVSMLKNFSSGTGFINDIDQNIEDDVISNIKCSTLIIHSKNDNSILFEHALHSKKMIKNSKLVELNNEWEHLLWIGTDSKKSIEVTMKFIEE